MANEFEEIAHSGGRVSFTITTSADGRRSFKVGFRGSRPVPMVMIAVYALPQGIPVAPIDMGGIGQAWNPPPFPDCLPVLIASDSEGKFGHTCPACSGYWRSGPWPNLCPYCGIESPGHNLLSAAQMRYLERYCAMLIDTLQSGKDGEFVIDMDAVADAAGKDEEKPPFYVSEESQQHKFTCTACGEFNDILGRYGYCSLCGTRNDLADFEGNSILEIRDRINNGHPPEDCVRDAVSSFDSYVAQVARELAVGVPMIAYRKNRLTKQRFHNLGDLQGVFEKWFGIDICQGMKDADQKFAERMFHRRHLYEHNGGEVDQKYIEESGDTTVRLKQRLRESQPDAHALLGHLVKMARNIHAGFHELFPPLDPPIKTYKDRQARTASFRGARSHQAAE
ncbi:conserved protein of unknown function [Cupriavidus taiwanensis]|uniref:Uncharacterized protein n=1 Tax=Cupriavidus taiwanensis TaxID=164546 RepID=A0A375IIJ6_9BURK|nr:hypothetical protein [Cupriavidus taiwanensis]SPK73035.1 conserved protein of unknown function [Cupriavidus taiwanensis]